MNTVNRQVIDKFVSGKERMVASVAAAIACLPLVLYVIFWSISLPLVALLAVNFAGWGIVAVYLYGLHGAPSSSTQDEGKSSQHENRTEGQSGTQALDSNLALQAFSMELSSIKTKITSDKALNRHLEELSEKSRLLLNADAVAITLADPKTGQTHCRRTSGNFPEKFLPATISKEKDGQCPTFPPSNVVNHAICFADARVGTFSVLFPEQVSPSRTQQEVIDHLAFQALALVLNAKYIQELLSLRAHSDSTLEAKTGFLATLSHEIRGPLGIISNANELLLDGVCGEVNPTQEQTLRMIAINAEHLQDLLNDVLDYAKIKSGKLEPNPLQLPLAELLAGMAEIVRAQAYKKGQSLRVLPGDPEVFITCDRRHFRQIMINLLTNAVKYTNNDGSIELSFSFDPDIGVATIEVTDDGIGIAPEHYHRVLSPFERVDDKAPSASGTGLGMPLSKLLVECNGGTIGFMSAVDEGTTFSISLPAQLTPAQANTEVESEKKKINGVQKQVLLLMPEADEAHLFEEFFKSKNYQVTTASSLRTFSKEENVAQVALVLIDHTQLESRSDVSAFEAFKQERLSAQVASAAISSAEPSASSQELGGAVDLVFLRPMKMEEIATVCADLMTLKSDGDMSVLSSPVHP